MRRFLVFCYVFCLTMGVHAQPKHVQTVITDNPKAIIDTVKNKIEPETKKRTRHKKMIPAADTLTMSDYMISIERVNDNLNAIRDSIKLGFEVVALGRKIEDISSDTRLIRQNIRDKNTVVNMKNLYLYQSFASSLDNENERIQNRLNRMYKKIYHAKLRLKNVLTDSVFRVLYADSSLRNTFDSRLIRLERKWARTDSTTKANMDTLNILKVKMSDNSMNLANMLNVMDDRLDKAGWKLFGPEVNCIWQKAGKPTSSTSKKTVSLLGSEQKAIGYYFAQTSGESAVVLVLGILLFIWLFLKRQLLRTIREQKEQFGFLHLQYLTNHPVLSLLVLMLSLMPLFDAYAPTSYIAIEYLLLLIISSIIFIKNEARSFLVYWVGLVILFLADTLTYLFGEPTTTVRLLMLAIHGGIIGFSLGFYRNLNKQMPWYRWIRIAAILGMVLAGLGILCNLFGRFSLAGIFGLAGVFAVTQAMVLPVFVGTIVEIILLQLQSRRFKKGIDRPFDCSLVIKKTKGPFLIVALLLWLIMLSSNLNIYHSLSNLIVEFLTVTRTIGSISFELISLLWFFMIIWLAHILQRLISFLFGETGSETEDMTTVSKGQHSRLLITRLLVLIGGYMLAIAASGLPIDKLTFLLGALGVGIGMGLQNVVNNFVSGIILIFDGSLQIGDEIEVNGQAGKVKEIGLRASTLNTSDGAEVIIPNGNILSQNIVNWTFSNDQKRVMIWFSLSGKELDANVINEVINDTLRNIPHVIAKRKPVILYTRVAKETCSLTVRFWTTISNADHVKSEAMLQLSAAFAAKQIGFE